MRGSRRVKIAYMGDSITFGQHVDPTLRWTTLVDASLREDGLEVDSANFGVSGETTRLGLERFPGTVQAAEATIMTLQYGFNDCNCWQTDRGRPRVSVLAFRANLLEMIDRARTFGAGWIILCTNHPTLREGPMVSGERYEDASVRYNEIVRAVAAEASVVLCDIRKAFAPYDKRELARLLLPAPDLLHLSVDGHQVYADAIRPFVQEAVLASAGAQPTGGRGSWR
jgi:lysophospholipase L1-like esterase